MDYRNYSSRYQDRRYKARLFRRDKSAAQVIELFFNNFGYENAEVFALIGEAMLYAESGKIDIAAECVDEALELADDPEHIEVLEYILEKLEKDYNADF